MKQSTQDRGLKMSKDYFDVDTIQAIINLIESEKEHRDELSAMWFRMAEEESVIEDDSHIDVIMWRKNNAMSYQCSMLAKMLKELKHAEIERTHSVIVWGYH